MNKYCLFKEADPKTANKDIAIDFDDFFKAVDAFKDAIAFNTGNHPLIILTTYDSTGMRVPVCTYELKYSRMQ